MNYYHALLRLIRRWKKCKYCDDTGYELVYWAIDSAENVYWPCPVCKGEK